MRFIAPLLFLLTAAFAPQPAAAQALDKSDYVILSIGKITLENVSADVNMAHVHCFTYLDSSAGIDKYNMNDPKRWRRSGHDTVAFYNAGIGDDRKLKVIKSKTISMFRQEDAPKYANGDKSYACKIMFTNNKNENASAGGSSAWTQGTGSYFVKGDF